MKTLLIWTGIEIALIVPLVLLSFVLAFAVVRRVRSGVVAQMGWGIGLYFLLMISVPFFVPTALDGRFATIIGSISTGWWSGFLRAARVR